MKSEWGTESQMATALQEHLERLGWDCYPEVAVNTGQRADLVAYMAPVIWVIEAKLSLNTRVCEQAVGWVGRAQLVSILVPRASSHGVLEEWCRIKGIGIIAARRREASGQVHVSFETWAEPRLNRRASARLKTQLHPDMKRYAPGTSAGYSSPWARTMNAAVAWIEAHPGARVKDLVKGIAHHYRTDTAARSCLLKWLERDARVRLQKDHGRVTFWPSESRT